MQKRLINDIYIGILSEKFNLYLECDIAKYITQDGRKGIIRNDYQNLKSYIVNGRD